MQPFVAFEDVMVEQLREDAAFRRMYLQIAWEDFQLDGNRKVLIASLRHIIKAQHKGTHMAKHTSFETLLRKHLSNNAELRDCYLQVAWENFQIDGDSKLFLLCLSDVIKAQGKEEEIASLLELPPSTLYQSLKEKPPSLLEMQKILQVLGYRLHLQAEASRQKEEMLEALAV